ncbi:MAG: hypothetical protein AB7G88_13880 [Thermomicrobiales bacterium]
MSGATGRNWESSDVLIRFIAIVMLSASLVNVASVFAQETPVTPDPELCTLEPRTIEDIESLTETSARLPDSPTPTPVPAPFEMPDGFSLLEDERTEIEKDLIRAIACVNTGDPLKVFATYSDRYVVELVERLGGMTDQVIAGLLTVRELTEAQRLQIISFDASILLHDGRALVIVTGDNPADNVPAGPRAFYLEESLPGRWLVDEIVEITVDDNG